MMLKYLIKSIIILLFYLTCVTQVFSLENKIIVKVDNEIITSVDIINEVKYLKALNPNLSKLDKNKIYQIAKSSLVREKIKLIEISKIAESKISEEYLENIIKNIYSSIGFNNKKEFIKYLNNFSIDIEEVENKLSNEALWNQLIYRNYYTKIKFDERKIRDEIKSINNETYSYLLYEILFNSDDKSEAEKLYNQIELSIEKNGFENTASIFSISESAKTGGKLGWIEEGSMSKKIVSEISQLKNDEYTKPILIPGGFLILSVKNKKKIQKNLDIEQEVKLKIKSIQNQQLNQFSNIYFNKIKKNVSINES
ncbi:peptidylprolyl isomerase [Candidatus Pelagibacter communis]|uniref:peptidylprolyl isomerase n=1 Tax=Pelagibacter ubique TaxID=198252 RepID=UPI0009E328C2|nr:peptidylprolyl isomerase [Candidatus Pelagibacter ubique]